MNENVKMFVSCMIKWNNDTPSNIQSYLHQKLLLYYHLESEVNDGKYSMRKIFKENLSFYSQKYVNLIDLSYENDIFRGIDIETFKI